MTKTTKRVGKKAPATAIGSKPTAAGPRRSIAAEGEEPVKFDEPATPPVKQTVPVEGLPQAPADQDKVDSGGSVGRTPPTSSDLS